MPQAISPFLSNLSGYTNVQLMNRKKFQPYTCYSQYSYWLYLIIFLAHGQLHAAAIWQYCHHLMNTRPAYLLCGT